MSRYAIIAVAAIGLFIVVGSWFFRDSADVDFGNTPSTYYGVPTEDGTRGVPPGKK